MTHWHLIILLLTTHQMAYYKVNEALVNSDEFLTS